MFIGPGLWEGRYQTLSLSTILYIVLYGPRNCKARRTSLGVKDPIAVCRKQETFQAEGKTETQLSPKQAEKKVKEIWRKDQYQEWKKPIHKETRPQLLLERQVHKLY